MEIPKSAKKIIVNVEDNKKVSVTFLGPHMSKRELIQILRAIRLEYRHKVVLYRRNITLKVQRSRVEVEAKAKVEEEEKKKTEDLGEKSHGNPVTRPEQVIQPTV